MGLLVDLRVRIGNSVHVRYRNILSCVSLVAGLMDEVL